MSIADGKKSGESGKTYIGAVVVVVIVAAAVVRSLRVRELRRLHLPIAQLFRGLVVYGLVMLRWQACPSNENTGKKLGTHEVHLNTSNTISRVVGPACGTEPIPCRICIPGCSVESARREFGTGSEFQKRALNAFWIAM